MLKQIKIGGVVYKVEVVDPTHPKLDNERNNGCYSTKTQTIYIANDITEQMQEISFLHEIIHAINLDYSEEQVEFLSKSIYQVLRDNNLSFK
jgi:hypothetical protein